MITLIKIRFKYISNHRCAVFLSYFFIPIILLIFLSILLISSPNYRNEFHENNKYEGKAFNITKRLFSQILHLEKDIFLWFLMMKKIKK